MPIVNTSLRSESSPSSRTRAVFRQRAGALVAILLLLAAMAYSASQAPLVLAAGPATALAVSIDPAQSDYTS